MCGIFGMSTNKPENLDVNGVHILGIYNIERGRMSCGLSWDGDVQYGLGFDKLYTDFIVDREIKPIKIPIMIGHTRQPSYGFAITEDNAHPFGFGTSKNKEGYEMIFCHNGTLKNHKELAKKYNIDLTEKIQKLSYDGHCYETTRDKIDSEVLGEILYKTKKFHVLSEYIGAAALAWTWIDEPNKLYLWSGASKTTQGSFTVTEVEERPMNVYCKNENSMFFSSLKDSLTVLGASKKDDLQIDYNTVYIITDGDFVSAEKHKVSRLQAGQNENITYNQKYSRYDYGNENYCDWEDVRSQNLNKISTDVNTAKNSMINLQNDKLIHPITYYKNKVYCKSLRYWENDSLINGVYLYIKNWGFKFAGIDTFTANAYVKIIKGLAFDYKEGTFNFNMSNKEGFIPFEKDVKNIQFHYFTDGVLLKTLEDYNRSVILNKDLKNSVKCIDYQMLSYISKHPIIDINSTKTPSVAMFDGKSFTGNITELGFEKIYYFNNGIFVKWVKREDLITKIETPVIILPSVIESSKFDKELINNSIKSIKDFEKNNEKVFNSEIITKELEDEVFISELILECFEKHAEEVSETIIELSDWKDNENVKTAINTLNLINHTLKDFVEKPNTK
jgi:predicted glutamine amidotransferase